MRIIGGKFRGRRLAAPKNQKVRPTGERVREAIFNILGQSVDGLIVLDLFAGTGAFGLEALSRGAAFVVFVDHHAGALRLLERNLQACGNPANAAIVRCDLARRLPDLHRWPHRYDLVFLDPPYRCGLAEACLQQLGSSTLLRPQARVVSEHWFGEAIGQQYGGLHLEKRRFYGDTAVSFFKWELKDDLHA